MNFKICVIGCGRHACDVHGPAYARYSRENPDVWLAACCDLNADAANAFRQRFGFTASYTDIKTMLNVEKPHAVALVVPYHQAAKLATMVMALGYPLITEKPPGANLDEVIELVHTATVCGVPNMVAFNRRHMPIFRKTQELIDGCSGPVHHIQYDFYRHNRRERDFESTAIHGIDVVRFLAGSDYQQVSFIYQPIPQAGEGVYNFYLQARFKNGTTAAINFCPNAGVVLERAVITQLDQTIFVNTPIWAGYDQPGFIKVVRGGLNVLDLSGEEVSDGPALFESNGFFAEDKYFFDCIKGGILPAHPISSARQPMELMACLAKRMDEYHCVDDSN